MNAGFKPWQKTFVSGGNAVVITGNETGFPLDAAAGNFQIVVTALGAGTWGVHVLGPDDVYRAVQGTTLAEVDIFTFTDEKVARGFKVVFANLGGADPKVTFVAQGRRWRFAVS